MFLCANYRDFVHNLQGKSSDKLLEILFGSFQKCIMSLLEVTLRILDIPYLFQQTKTGTMWVDIFHSTNIWHGEFSDFARCYTQLALELQPSIFGEIILSWLVYLKWKDAFLVKILKLFLVSNSQKFVMCEKASLK